MFVGFLLLFYVVVFWIWFIVIIILILILNLIVMFFNLIGLVCRGNSDNFNLCILVEVCFNYIGDGLINGICKNFLK